MKFLVSQMSFFLRNRTTRRNSLLLMRFVGVLAMMVVVYSVLFHFIMAYEGRGEEFSWLTGFYWTLTVMSTLGFGDITFHSDLGRLFSILVLLSGIVFLLVLLPFTFIQFFYAPWMEAEAAARAPRRLPEDIRGHVILTHNDPVTRALISKLTQFHVPYALLTSDLDEALQLHDEGIRVMLGDFDNPDTYRRLRVDKAALVAATTGDAINTNIAFTVQEVHEKTPIIATADDEAAVDILRLAGASHVLRLHEAMGKALARRAKGGDAVAHIIGKFDELLIAEATVNETPLVGKTLVQSTLREEIGVNVVGVWERGFFKTAGPDTLITPSTVLVMAGSAEQMSRFDERFLPFHKKSLSGAPVLVIGGGRVGVAAVNRLSQRGIESRVIDREQTRGITPERFVIGDAADISVLELAGITQTPSVIITTHDDDTNIYLTIYCRRLRPDIQIISRATMERNVATLHRAGADFVISQATMGANMIFNLLEQSDVLMVAEGLNVVRVPTPPSLLDQTLSQSHIRQRTGSTVVALVTNGRMQVNPDPNTAMIQGSELILIGTVEAEKLFFKTFVED
jgi:Trk K+ transport system NAD-binding subunit